ncbi:hypothetical protein B0T17DRAFT_609355 [Bombardia bombarda]|uniref:Sec20 C-terminal domain-containing protein n=1 Tax=Bombardia bombarda TaxID=252184 RepID=A0AA39WMT4_9PEZI|nr:hypothetical protein B0T17DRAFT_609355 [Bombardia bombarda]
MSSFESLQERLTALQETTGHLKELIHRLVTIKFQPGSVPLGRSTSSLGGDIEGEEEDNVATEISTEISQVLREEEEELELLREDISGLPTARPGSDAGYRRLRLDEGAQRVEDELKTCRISFRKARSSAQASIKSAQKLERELLLSSYSGPATTVPQQLFTPRDRRRLLNSSSSSSSSSSKSGTNRDVVAASGDVTDALRRTHSLIADEMSRSAFAARTLAESTAALKDLTGRYEGVGGLLARSRDLVGTLLTTQKSDTWYLQTAMHALLATLAWLVFRRFLYGPMWWLVWLPVRTVWCTGRAVVPSGSGAVQSGGGARMEVPVEGQKGGGYRVVGVGEEGAVPTVRVGGEDRGKVEEVADVDVDVDSMVEKVGRIIDDSLSGEDVLEGGNVGGEAGGDGESDEGGGGGGYQRNPMKRMWEEDLVGENAPERVRDEL